MAVFIGCAGWNLRQEHAALFPTSGSHLERYASRLSCVEINSSFYRSHQTKTYQRWAATTPGDFRFAVKLPKQISHVSRLSNVEPELQQFVDETSGLGDKLGVVLVQLPPSLAFQSAIAERFFQDMRSRIRAPISCEPRHPSWFEQEPALLMKEYAVSRVAADPAIVPGAAVPGGCGQTAYFRWHGSPRTYYSAYDDRSLKNLADAIANSAKSATDVWCIFDNTAEGFATPNALALSEKLWLSGKSRMVSNGGL